MTAITQRLLHLRPTPRPHTFSLHRFSTSSDSGSPSDIPQPTSDSQPHPQPSVSSYLNDVKASLQREPPPQNRLQPPRRPVFTAPPHTPPSSGASKSDDILRNLADFRSRYASSPPSASVPSVSLQELYQRNLNGNSAASSNSAINPSRSTSFDAIRNSIKHLRTDSTTGQNPSGKLSDPYSLARFKETLNGKQPSNAYTGGDNGGGIGLPSYIENGKHMSGGDNEGIKGAMRTGFVKIYNYSELGTKLKQLRPETKKGKWFSLHELNERLAKLRQIEEQQQSQLGMGASMFVSLRGTLQLLSKVGEEKEKKKMKQKLNILGQLGGTPSYMLSPPKDHLVEKYFHPDNLSSADKLKLELKKVRDEFKMSESDCGSARVQVAQLTTKIKHLSTVLQKKDKHSRRGLQLMVQRRKKLLKYLRRTDWDSYSLVLSKLGLRDNPDIKA